MLYNFIIILRKGVALKWVTPYFNSAQGQESSRKKGEEGRKEERKEDKEFKEFKEIKEVKDYREAL